MRIYYLITGVFCIMYYLVMYLYTRKWASTFSLFWPAAGALHLLLAYLVPGGTAGQLLSVIVLICWAVFLYTEAWICRAMLRRTKEEVPCIIILGAQVRGTQITNSLKRRLDAALVYLEQYPETKAVVSGGQGKGEDITEAEAMAVYLEQQGIDGNRISQEDSSTSTWENMKNSGRMIGDLEQPAAVVTNNFHLYRALLIGKKAGFTNLKGIAAGSNPVLLLNYLVREFFAVLWIKIRQ